MRRFGQCAQPRLYPTRHARVLAPRGLHDRLGKVEEEVLGKAYDSRLMRRLLGYMRPYKMLVAVSLLFLLAQSMLQVLGPLLTRTAIDKYLQRSSSSVPTFLDARLPADPWAGLTSIGLLYLGVLLGSFVAEFAQTYLMQYTGQLAMFDLRSSSWGTCKGWTWHSTIAIL
jgi:ABC-type bacteriocin/lantibiotic exporter with double-glycine peptidase domain